ncbi:MAG: hypothetical protein ACREI7_07990 [Myxococcota bacterium]
MPHALRAALLVCLLLPASAGALTIGVTFAGTVEALFDPENLLDASVSGQPQSQNDPPATTVSGTYTVDLPGGAGGSPFEVGVAHLFFTLGNYTFDGTQSAHAIAMIDNQDTGIPGVTTDHWQTREITLSDLDPATQPTGNFAGYAGQIDFFDNTSTQFDGSETAPIVPSDLTGWEPTHRLTLNFLKDNGDGTTSFDPQRFQLQVNLTSWSAQPVPEPRSAALLAFGLASLALRARKFRAASRRRAKTIRWARVR